MADKLNTTELDFDTIKNNLITYFKNVTDSNGERPYKDYDFNGSSLNMLIGVLAYNTHYNAMTAHMAVNETFIDSAQLRSSVVSAAKLLGYVPKSFTSSRVEATIEITAAASPGTQLPDSIYLDRNTIIKSASSYKTYYYVLSDGANFTKANGSNVYTSDSKLILLEGQRVVRRYPANGSYDYEKYIIDDDNIDTSSLIVRVYSNPNSTNATRYFRYEDISKTSPEANLFYLSENALGKFEITFGNGIISKKLEALNVIELEYIITKGKEANGANGKFSVVSTSLQTPNVQYSFSITPSGPSSGGSNRESVDEIRFNATSGFVSQNRAVTADDYENVIRKDLPIVDSVSVWGGEDNDPPQYGKVFVSPTKGLDSEEDDKLSASEKQQLLSVLRNKKVIAILPEIVDAERVNIVLDILFKYNNNITNVSNSELENSIRANIIDGYNQTKLKGFGKIFRHSEFTKAIDTSSAAILNSHVRVFVSKTFTIDPLKNTLIEIKYGTQLTTDDGGAIASYVTSSPWTYKGINLFIGDKPDPKSDTRRILYTYEKTESGNVNIVHENIGDIVLSSGYVNIFPLNISDDTFTLTMDLIPISDDIVSRRNQIIKIDEDRCNVTAYVDEIAVGGSSRSISYQTFKRDR